MDDFPGNFEIEATLAGESQRFHSRPVQLRADFQDDGDWIEIFSARPNLPERSLLDWGAIVYSPEDGLDSIVGQYQWAVFDDEMNELHSGSEFFRVPLSFRNTGKEKYLRITANANQEVDPVTGETVDVPAFYRVGVGLTGDFAGDSIADAVPYENNYKGVVSGGIRNIDDVDFHAVDLEVGVEYEFTVFGRDLIDWELPDLENPTFELHDENGLVAESVVDDQGVRFLKARQINYTAAESKTYYLRVGSETDITGTASFSEEGTYIIRSPQFDDDRQADSPLTRTVLQPGDSFTNSIDFEGDEDWVALPSKRFIQYGVTGDADLVKITNDLFQPLFGEPSEISTQVFEGGSLQFAAISPDHETTFEFDIVDKHPDDDISEAELLSENITGAIGRSGDVDLLSVELVPFADYRFSVAESEEGSWTDSLVVEWLNPDNSVARRFDITNEFNFFRIDSDERYSEQFSSASQTNQVIRIRSKTGEVTGYQLLLNPIGEDQVSDVPGEAPDLNFSGSFARVRGLLESPFDFDAYRLQLEGNTWYSVRGGVSPAGNARLFRFGEDGYELVNRGAFHADTWIAEPGEYFLRVGDSNPNNANGFAGYDLQVVEDALPVSTIKRVVTADEGRPLTQFAGGRDLPTEVWSEVPLLTENSAGNTVNIAANELVELTAAEWETLRLAPSASGTADIFYRNVSVRQTPWEVFEVVENRIPTEFDEWFEQNSNVFMTYNFPDELPEYLEDDARFNSSFAPVTDGQKNLTEFAINGWRDARSSLFPAGSNPETAQMQIFQADLGPDVDFLSFAPVAGSRLGGDLVLNSSSGLFSDLERPQEAIFNLLRGVGSSFGLPELDSVDRFQSVMGTASVDPDLADVYPSWPMPLDSRLTKNDNHNYSGVDVFRFQPGSYVHTAMGRPDNRIEVAAADGYNFPVSINLEAGASSSSIGTDDYQVINMGAFTNGFKGVGGDGNDGVKGNSRANVLVGNGGNDVLEGDAGNDQLFGGTGDDYYIFKSASGIDQINEIGGGGTDVVRFEGMHDYDSIAEDFTFRRFGNDLLIRLELNGLTNNNGDQIRIRNMHEETSRIEAMALFNTDGFVNRISLQSVWEQADEVRRRFQVVAGNDGFGTLVSPV